MVDRDDMPAILADLQSAAYLVYWNKRYGESDPKLSGQNFTLDGIKASELTKLLQRIGGPRGDGVIKHLAKKNEKLSDIVDIKKFYVQLKNEMIDMVSRRDPTFLEVGNIIVAFIACDSDAEFLLNPGNCKYQIAPSFNKFLNVSNTKVI